MKPIWLVSPMTVAQYLKPETEQSDLLIIDEVSKMQPCDALGALARAKRAMIVGDPQQLPPTGFFTASAGESVDSDEDVGLDEESILEKAAMRLPMKRTLRWHYRSRDPSLIAFSNQHFYGGRLVLFPSSMSTGTMSGVRLVSAAGLRHEDDTNSIEAQVAIDQAIDCLWLDVRPAEKTQEGVRVLRDYLKYTATGRLLGTTISYWKQGGCNGTSSNSFSW